MSVTEGSIPDASISARFKTDDYDSWLTAVFSIVDEKPTGNLSLLASGDNIWRVTSTVLREINTEIKPSAYVHASFGDVTVKNETTGKKYDGCTAFLDAVDWPTPGGTGGVNVTLVVYHSTRVKPIFEWDAIFEGTISVNRDISYEE